MRCSFHATDIKFLSKTIVTLSKFNNEVRIVTTEDEFRVEAMKGEHALAQLVINKEHFDNWDPSSPANVWLKSKSLRVIFRNANNLAKNMMRMEIWIENEHNLALFKIVPRHYAEKVIKIPVVTVLQMNKIPIPDYSSFDVHIISDSKTWLSGLKLFPGSIDLVTTRFRPQHVKMETGDEKSLAPIMTKFNFHLEEFKFCEMRREVVCTYALRPVMDFLQIWDPKFHTVESYYDSREQVPVLYLVKDSNYEAKLVLAKASINNQVELMTDSDDDDNDAHSIQNTTSCSRPPLTTQIQPGTSRPDPRNRFIFRSGPMQELEHMSSASSTVPRSTAPSKTPTASNILVSENPEDEFEDDGLDDVPTHILTQMGSRGLLSAGAEEFDDMEDESEIEAINQSVRVSQAMLVNRVIDIPTSGVIGEPVYHSTQSAKMVEGMNETHVLKESHLSNNFIGNMSMEAGEKFEQQRRFLGLGESSYEPSQEYEILADDSDEEN